jgi:hypothetical protein
MAVALKKLGSNQYRVRPAGPSLLMPLLAPPSVAVVSQDWDYTKEEFESAFNESPDLEYTNQDIQYLAIAKDPNTSDETLIQLSMDPDPAVRIAVAQNPSIPPRAFDILMGDSVREVRWAIATNEEAMPGALMKLLEDEDADVSRMARQNCGLPCRIRAPYR